ncbi:Zinc finger protein 345, partial [Calypte anna]
FVHHLKGHKERPPYQCPQCDYSCISISYLLNHMYWHAGYKLYQCRFCTFFSLYFASMVRHSHIHTGAKPYPCEFCQSAFATMAGLKRHRRLHAGQEMCQGQQLDFVSGGKKAQRPLRSYRCDECNAVFYTRGHLSFHKKFHEHQPSFYQCVECDYTTYILSNLKLHVRTHTGEKPHDCSVCHKKFRTSSHLKRHRITHFNTGHFKETQLPFKIYSCEECGYSTAHNGNLKPHLRIHTGEKPFKCSQCLLAFRTSSHLKRHFLTH